MIRKSALRKRKIVRICNDIYMYQIDKIILKLLKIFIKGKKLKDVIIIESHNDFDCNGGAFYNYLIDNGYNEKYKIVWLLKKPSMKPKKLPFNVKCCSLYGPSIKKNYYNLIAKYMTADNWTLKKQNPDQMSLYFTHGCGGFKSVKGLMTIPNDVDYILLQSERYAPIQAEQYSLKYPSNRLVFLGYPSHDVMHNADGTEINKITEEKYNKIIIWMPTFRKGGGTDRNDSTKEQPLGIPLIESIDEYNELNGYLSNNNILLILKLHPMQDLSNLKVKSLSNICILSGNDVKQKGIDNYRLLPCVDAMISDYSGIAFEFLQLNKPIAYVFDDMEYYKPGFVVDDIDTLLAGPKILTFGELIEFIEAVSEDNDGFEKKRTDIRDYIYKYHDANSCKRIAEFMGLVR